MYWFFFIEILLTLNYSKISIQADFDAFYGKKFIALGLHLYWKMSSIKYPQHPCLKLMLWFDNIACHVATLNFSVKHTNFWVVFLLRMRLIFTIIHILNHKIPLESCNNNIREYRNEIKYLLFWWQGFTLLIFFKP